MANLDNVLQQLREEHKQAQGAVEKLRQAISSIERRPRASQLIAEMPKYLQIGRAHV